MNNDPIQIKKQDSFDLTLREAVPIAEYREEVERAIRFAVTVPGMGKHIGNAAPLMIPLYALPLRKSAFNPPLVVYYCQYARTVILMSVRVTAVTEE